MPRLSLTEEPCLYVFMTYIPQPPRPVLQSMPVWSRVNADFKARQSKIKTMLRLICLVNVLDPYKRFNHRKVQSPSISTISDHCNWPLDTLGAICLTESGTYHSQARGGTKDPLFSFRSAALFCALHGDGCNVTIGRLDEGHVNRGSGGGVIFRQPSGSAVHPLRRWCCASPVRIN